MRFLYLTFFYFSIFSPVSTWAQVANDFAETDENTPVTISVTDNDTDDDGIDPASVDLNTTMPGRQKTINLADGSFAADDEGNVTFTPSLNFHGVVQTDYLVRNSLGNVAGVAVITVTVNSINNPPVAVDDVASTDRNTNVDIPVTVNDSDADGTLDLATIDLDPSLPGIQSVLVTLQGTWTVSAGSVTYSPALNFTGVASITYTINDDEGATSNPATITVTVNSNNAAPVANDDAMVTDEDTPTTYEILANDTDDYGLDPTSVDLDPDTAGKQSTRTLSGGNVSVNSSGLLSYTPLLNYNGAFSFQYTVNDIDGVTSNRATVAITVNSVNDPPVANPDVASTNEDTPVTITVTANDTDVDGTIDASTVDLDPSTAGIQNTRTTSNGSYSVDNSGVVTFTPAANYYGNAVIQYTVRDNEGATSNQANITITVIRVNDNPVANDDATSTPKNTPVTIPVTANDTDDGAIDVATVDLDPSTSGIQNSRTVAAGTFTVNSSGVVTFSPVDNFFGVVSITYTVNDNEGATSNQATITVTVLHINQKPIANPDAVTTDEDTPITFNVLTNDSDDIELNPASVDLNVAVAGIQNTRTTAEGSYSVDGLGNVTYTPTLNFFGTATIQYTVNDNEGATSDPAQITITVNSVNDSPVANDDSRTINEDNSVAINILANDTDVDGTLVPTSVDLDPSTPGIQTSITVSGGTFSVDAQGVVTFVPVTNFFGTVVINYTVMDNDGALSNVATITVIVNPVNDPPIANNDVASTPQGQPVTINILANDIDVDGTINASTVDLIPATGTIDKVRVVASGTYSVDDAGVVTFTPVPTFSGTSSITYTVQDNLGAVSNIATISVLVNFVNSPPVANDDAVTTNEDTPVSINVLANDTDDGTLNAATVDLNPAVSGIQNSITTSFGTFTVNGSGLVTYTPALNFNGTATVTYTVNDNIGETSNIATLTVTVLPVNDAPVANNDAITTNENVPVNINVIANDTDVDGTIDPATVDLLVATEEIDRTRTIAQGTFTANESTGIVTFTPAANFFGTATINYNVRDNLGAKSNNATITVTVINVNDPPSFDEIPAQRVLRNAATKSVTITGISPGPQETENVLLSAFSNNTSLIPHPTISYPGTGSTGTLTFKPQLNQTGTTEVTVKAVDAGLNEFSRTFRIDVINVVIASTPVSLAVPGELYQYTITTTDVDETLTLDAIQKPAWATLTSTGKNTALLSGTPPANAVSSTVTIQLRDGALLIDEQQFVLSINRRPSSQNFGIQTNEDVSVILTSDQFVMAFSDPDNHALSGVQFTLLPKHGTLSFGATPIQSGEFISVSGLNNVVYSPAPDYFGPDTVYFKVSDSFSYSEAASYIHFVVNPVNDPPRITFLETQALEHDIGRELAQIFTSSFTAIDVEEDEIIGAEIGFRKPNYNAEHDLLTFTNTAKIKGSYNESTGILTLVGAASVSEYEEAIRSITYSFINLREIILEPRTVYITLSDAGGTSEPAERVIKLIFNFVDLKLPQVFTPDGNGMNDLWPFATDDGLEPYDDAVIRIFDNRGKLIYETLGFASPWDGKRNGEDVPIGTYFYVIDLKYGKIRYNGSVTILRAER